MRKIEGTDKFVVYFYNGKNIRGKRDAKPKHFTFYQWGMIKVLDERGKEIGNKRFNNYGQMIDFINKHMRKKVMKNLKEKRNWS